MTVIDEIATERQRQIEDEGWTPEHDDELHSGTLASAGATYAILAAWPEAAERAVMDMPEADGRHCPYSATRLNNGRLIWPFDFEWLKPRGRRRDLVRAAALIVAEIERLDRAAAKSF